MIRLRPPLPVCRFILMGFGAVGCTFNFEITSQRTALENQIIGSYQELNDDVVISSSVRSLSADGKKKEISTSRLQEEAVKARQSQQFNLDDLDELKAEEVIGEKNDGTVAVLPDGLGKASVALPARVTLAKVVMKEENRDRETIWKRIVFSNESLSDKDLPAVKIAFVRMQRETAGPGHWLQDEQGKWFQKK